MNLTKITENEMTPFIAKDGVHGMRNTKYSDRPFGKLGGIGKKKRTKGDKHSLNSDESSLLSTPVKKEQ